MFGTSLSLSLDVACKYTLGSGTGGSDIFGSDGGSGGTAGTVMYITDDDGTYITDDAGKYLKV